MAELSVESRGNKTRYMIQRGSMNLTGAIVLMSMSEINRNITLKAAAMTV